MGLRFTPFIWHDRLLGVEFATVLMNVDHTDATLDGTHLPRRQ